MTDQLHERMTRVAPFGDGTGRPAAPPAPTGWAMKRRVDTAVPTGSACPCGSDMGACAGCGELRCLVCDPYLSDDCRWSL